MKENIAKLVSGFITITLVMQLCACQKRPNEVVVSSNENGAFDANEVKSAIEEDTLDVVQTVEITDDFYSSDGSVHFLLNLDTSAQMSTMPIVEVVPYYLKEKDVRAVANALFDENDVYYEARINSNRIYSRSELLEQINRWSQYTQEQSVISLYGENRGNITEKVKRAIERNTILCESAPEEDVRLPARWTFQKDSFYYLTDEERLTHDFSEDNDAIMLEVTHRDLPYLLSAAKRNSTDYKISNISAYLNEGSAPRQLDSRIFQAQLCRTNEPDAQQIELIKTKAQSILDSIDLGQWKIDQYFVEEQHYGESAEYIIHIAAVPVFSGVPACRRPQIDSLKSYGCRTPERTKRLLPDDTQLEG